jgi:hypothetical protein
MPTLGDIAPPRQGLATTDNARFVRYWWEVEGASPQKWRPYAKAGQFRRWYQRPMHCVNWQNDGAEIKQSICDRYPYLKGKWQWVAKNSEYYGRPGITYSYLTSGNFSARLMPEGSLFDVAGSALFPGDPLTMLAILNSSAARELLHAINPTVNFQVGDLRLLPIPREPDERLRHHVSRAIELQKRLDQFDETTPDFVAPMPWESAAELHRSMYESLRRTETEIDTIVAQHYGMSSQYEGMIPAFEPVDLARRWVSVAVRRLLTRVQVADPACEQTIAEVREILVEHAGPAAAKAIERACGGLRFPASGFIAWHNRLYRRRPIIWSFGDDERSFWIHHERASADVIGSIFARLGAKLPDKWNRMVDDGIQINLSPLHASVSDQFLRKHLQILDADLREGRFAWSQTSNALA